MAAKSCREDKSKWLSFVTHAYDTASVINRLFDNWLSEHEREYLASQLGINTSLDECTDIIRRICRLTALLHDIGKLTYSFQYKITDNIEGHAELLYSEGITFDRLGNIRSVPHAAAGAVILEYLGFSHGFAVIIGSHHGKCDTGDDEFDENYFGCGCFQEKIWTDMWNEWISQCLNDCGFDEPADVPEINVKLQMLITSLLIMSDWIASNTEYFPLTDTFEIPDFKETRAEDAFEKLGLPSYWEADSYFIDFNDRFGFEPNEVQQEVMNIISEVSSAGIYILEAPMGLGKTEAALAAAEILAARFGCGGLFFGLPTQATANGIFGRILSWTEKQCDSEKHTIRLAHGMTELNEEYQHIFHGRANDVYDDSELFVHDWFEGRKQALLADFVIGTVDQFLLASLKQKHVMLRHLGLSGKVVIIDECHAYDAYMNVYLDNTLAWMGAYNVPVIILSATLPPKRRAQLVKAYLNSKKDIAVNAPPDAYPVLTWTDNGEINSRTLSSNNTDKQVYVERLSEDQIGERLSEKLKCGGCAAVIVNTVRRAQQLAKDLAEQLDDFEVVCFHSRFTATDRADIEKSLLKRAGKGSQPDDRDRLIVIGTQVIEQSLDLDFDYMITELCPMDLLLQRSGRLHRHVRQRPAGLENAVLSVIEEIDSGTEFVYGKWLLKQTEKYLPDKLTIPKCISELVSKVYEDSEISDVDWNEYCQKLSDKKEKAKKYCINASSLKKHHDLDYYINDDVGNSTDAEASVRDGSETIEVLLMCEHEKGVMHFLPWRNDGAAVDTTCAPNEKEVISIARERVHLPAWFSKTYNYDKTVKQLRVLPERWQDEPLLKGELLLVLNDDLETELIGRKLRYSKEYGLEEIKEGNDGQGI
ncbi:MAG: CRISPR-associated helicase Cas3' [Ruminococcus sp.]|uniref:CRISPR-associated helicase Cas3' n=1 Tax=Ruminococcus sp. TaxID=41978 RepID=UPI0026004F3B|nr:CRISPR-associated helicase Cas3' [Ruminococcus sp.]MBO4865833.1 CRISPR-associated helicase Cas3' [Ruminococcus sp.]